MPVPTCRLLEHCRRHRYLSQSGEELALLLSTLLENLLAYRTITHDESPEHRMSCTVNVLVRLHARSLSLPVLTPSLQILKVISD